MSGRRTHERFDLEMPVVFIHDGQEFEATTTNLSLGGMFIVTPEKLTYGAEILVRFRLPSLREPTDARVVVRWIEDHGVGVQWMSLRAIEVWGLNQFFRAQSAG